MDIAVQIQRPLDRNPITLLMLRSGADVTVTPPEGYQLLADERGRLIKDEQRSFLIDIEEA